MGSPSAGDKQQASLISREFLLLSMVASSFFFAMGTTFPVLPRFVKDELGRGDTTVGIVVGATALGAILARPMAGYVGDHFGRRVLMISGALVASASVALHLFGENEAILLLVRVLYGLGQGGLMVGATTIAVDLAPEDRRGEATSYIFVALHLGSGSGPILGEWLLNNHGFNAVWLTSAGITLLAAALGVLLPPMPDDDDAPAPNRLQLFHPSGVKPGMVLGLGIIGFTGFNSFAPLYADEIGVGDIAPVFLASSFTIVLMRSFGAKWPDKLGPMRGGTFALSVAATGLVIIGLVQNTPGLFAGTIIMSAGISQLLPSLVSAAVAGVPVTQRSAAMGTYTLFMEISLGVGAVGFGLISSGSSYGTAFLVCAGTTLAALVLLWTAVRSALE